MIPKTFSFLLLVFALANCALTDTEVPYILDGETVSAEHAARVVDARFMGVDGLSETSSLPTTGSATYSGSAFLGFRVSEDYEVESHILGPVGHHRNRYSGLADLAVQFQASGASIEGQASDFVVIQMNNHLMSTMDYEVGSAETVDEQRDILLSYVDIGDIADGALVLATEAESGRVSVSGTLTHGSNTTIVAGHAPASFFGDDAERIVIHTVDMPVEHNGSEWEATFYVEGWTE